MSFDEDPIGAEMPDRSKDFSSFEDLLPSSSVPEAGLRIVSYISEDGRSRHSYQFVGSSRDVPKAVGLVVMALVDFITDQGA